MKRKKAAGDKVVKSKLAAVPTQRTKVQHAEARKHIEDIFASHKPVRQVRFPAAAQEVSLSNPQHAASPQVCTRCCTAFFRMQEE